MDQDEIRVEALQPLDGALATVRGAIVDNPKDATGVAVGHLAHHLRDEAIKRLDARLGLAAAEEFGAVDVPGCQIVLMSTTTKIRELADGFKVLDSTGADDRA